MKPNPKFTWDVDDLVFADDVGKYNENHDQVGRFASGPGGGGDTANWTRPTDDNLAQEYKVEYKHHLIHQTGDIFPTEKSFVDAVKAAPTVTIDREMDARIGNRTHITTMDGLLRLISGYRSYPQFRNEHTLAALGERVKGGKEVDMPIVIKDGNHMQVFSGNTRMDIGFTHHDAVKAVVLDIGPFKKYNESHDALGRFATGGGGGMMPDKAMRDLYSGKLKAEAGKLTPAQLEEQHQRESKFVKGLAEKFDYDPDLVDVSYDVKTFKLNGEELHYGGGANPNTGKITIWPDEFSTYSDIQGVMAHEVMHQRYQNFKETLDAERQELNMQATSAGWGEKSPLTPSGAIKPEFANDFPTYAGVHGVAGSPIGRPGATLNDPDKLGETDGVTDYSRQWWKAVKERTAASDSAINETLAEIAQLEHKGRTGFDTKDPFTPFSQTSSGASIPTSSPSNEWGKLYNLVNATWNRREGGDDAPKA